MVCHPPPILYHNYMPMYATAVSQDPQDAEDAVYKLDRSEYRGREITVSDPDSVALLDPSF